MTTSADQAVWAFTEHEHRDLARGITRIHDVACEAGRGPAPERSGAVRQRRGGPSISSRVSSRASFVAGRTRSPEETLARGSD